MLIIGGNSARVGGADMCCMALLLFVFVGRRAELDRFRLGAWVVILLSRGRLQSALCPFGGNFSVFLPSIDQSWNFPRPRSPGCASVEA
ncbi:hypothetical protein [Nocardia gipuzkoensis]